MKNNHNDFCILQQLEQMSKQIKKKKFRKTNLHIPISYNKYYYSIHTF